MSRAPAFPFLSQALQARSTALQYRPASFCLVATQLLVGYDAVPAARASGTAASVRAIAPAAIDVRIGIAAVVFKSDIESSCF